MTSAVRNRSCLRSGSVGGVSGRLRCIRLHSQRPQRHLVRRSRFTRDDLGRGNATPHPTTTPRTSSSPFQDSEAKPEFLLRVSVQSLGFLRLIKSIICVRQAGSPASERISRRSTCGKPCNPSETQHLLGGAAMRLPPSKLPSALPEKSRVRYRQSCPLIDSSGHRYRRH